MCQNLIQTVRRSIQAKAALAFVQLPAGKQRVYVILTLGPVVSRQEQLYFRDGREVEGVLFSALADSCIFAFEKELLQIGGFACGAMYSTTRSWRRCTPIVTERCRTGGCCWPHVRCNGEQSGAASAALKSMCLLFDLTDDKDMFHMEHDCAACPH